MSTLITANELALDFGEVRILREASFALEAGERVCLVGRNGAGKSTLFRIITGEQDVDVGELRTRQNLRISQLEQTLPEALDHTVHEHVATGLGHLRSLIDQYRTRSREIPGPEALGELESLQRRIEAEGGWNPDKRVETILSELNLPADKPLRTLSGGWRRRVGMARALVSNPEVLLLDEPTNHLDLAAIRWLEDRIREFSASGSCAVLFITHDRAFLQSLATRILELDRGRLVSWPGDYRNFLRRREAAREAEAVENREFEKKLAEEEAWIRQGIKARRTRNEGRVRSLMAMREEAAERAEMKPEQGARIQIEQTDEVSGRKVIELFNVQHGYDGEPLIDGLSLKVMRGDRIGLVGNNGVGKSTLLRLMLGEEKPNAGTIKLGTNLQLGYFDQMRRELDPRRTVAEIVGDGREYITLDGKQRHVIGYLRGFLFTAKRANTKVGSLSGGECNRVLLARLFTRPSNLLVLDEPTNDLDVETLEVLEERLGEYPGTLIVVSHDRAFLDNVVTSILVFEQGGRVRHYVGGFSDWLKRGLSLSERDDPTSQPRNGNSGGPPGRRRRSAPTKLSYKLQRELDALPDRIEVLEKEVAALEETTAAQGFFEGEYVDQVQPVLEALDRKRAELEAAVERWAELEAESERLG